MIIQALRKGLIEHEASDTGGVPRWKSSCPDRLLYTGFELCKLNVHCDVRYAVHTPRNGKVCSWYCAGRETSESALFYREEAPRSATNADNVLNHSRVYKSLEGMPLSLATLAWQSEEMARRRHELTPVND